MTQNRPVALVTGASSGIGHVASLALIQAGFDVVGTSRNTNGIGYRDDGVFLMDLDVTNDESVDLLVKRVIERFGRIDVLVNNAGLGASGAAEENSVAQVQGLFDINVFGVVRMTKAVLPYMRAQGGGRIINISSIYGFMPAPYMAAYGATKYAVEGYSESVDHEVRGHGVRVIVVEPAWTKTAFDDRTVQPDRPLEFYAEQRAITAAVVAEAVNDGDDPAVVAKAIVAAATDKKPKLRYPAGRARTFSIARRFLPTRAFDRQVHTFNKLAG